MTPFVETHTGSDQVARAVGVILERNAFTFHEHPMRFFDNIVLVLVHSDALAERRRWPAL